MGIVSFVIISYKAIKLEFVAVFRCYFPIEKGAEWIALHDTVEQATNLIRVPYKLPLYSWQHKLVALNVF